MKIGRPQGFTLIEAVMTCVLLSIVAVLVMPNISGYYAEAKLRALSGKIVWHLRLCRQLAISRRSTLWVVFDVDDNSYALYEERYSAPLSYLTSEFETEVDIEEEYAGLSLSEVNIGGDHEVGFNSLGSPLDMDGDELVDDGVVVIRNGDGTSKTVGIAARTGRAFVE